MQRSGYVAIVDDDASMREALARLLRVHGINSRNYPSARAFLEALPSHMPDCLIVDVNMPDMTGIELQRELLNRGVRIPTIVITASNDKSIAASAASLEAAAFFVKPVPRDARMAAINSVKKRHFMHTPDDFDHSGVVVDWLARISHTAWCVGAANQRKLLCSNDLSPTRRAPRCRQSVARICLDSQLLKDAK
jgi:FixJ family two-component response regulator